MGSGAKGAKQRVQWALLVWLSFCGSLQSAPPKSAFEDPQSCARCHVQQHQEWQGSMMHYSAESPVFQTFELTTRKLTGRFGRHDKQNPTFCINCHSPTGAYDNDLRKLAPHEATLGKLSATSRNGIHCTMCHTIRGPEPELNLAKGLLGDSIANASHDFMPLPELVGPTTEAPLPEPNEFHQDGFEKEKKSSLYLRSDKMCGSCHNVHVPDTPDTFHKTPYQRQENLFTEWEQGPYNGTKNPHGKKVGCVDCHMSLYASQNPVTKQTYGPGIFPVAKVAAGFNRERRHALHRFTAVSTSLLGDNPNFPNQNTLETDLFNVPKGQQQRREQLLRIACTLQMSVFSPEDKPEDLVLPVELKLTNTGAGHRVPSGFSQEREMWVELCVRDQAGRVIYSAGSLRDRPHPETGELSSDGRTHDEDLSDTLIHIRPADLEAEGPLVGPEFNLRPFRALGMPTFNNAFLRQKTEKSYERVHFFTKANHMDNDRSLPILRPASIRYDIPLSAWARQNPNYCGSVSVEAKLQFRTLPPKLLRALIQREPQLLNEAHLDRNTVVTMADAHQQVRLCNLKPKSEIEGVSVDAQRYSFQAAGAVWQAYPTPVFLEQAQEKCEATGCQLPTLAEMDALGFANYAAKPGDNRDELWTERWLKPTTAGGETGTTYFFGAGPQRMGSVPLKGEKALRLPYFCRCGASTRGAK